MPRHYQPDALPQVALQEDEVPHRTWNVADASMSSRAVGCSIAELDNGFRVNLADDFER
jgi:hypothetical protein